jgi:hypothetical protein
MIIEPLLGPLFKTNLEGDCLCNTVSTAQRPLRLGRPTEKSQHYPAMNGKSLVRALQIVFS